VFHAAVLEIDASDTACLTIF